MLKKLTTLNTNLNLFQALSKKARDLVKFLKTKKLLTLSIVLAIVAFTYFAYQKYRPKSPDELYLLDKVIRTDITKTVLASGKVKSQTQVDLKFQASGKLTWVGIKEGDTVKAWQALASLDQQELQKTLTKALRDYSKERNDFDEDKLETYHGMQITETIRRILEKNQWDLDKAVLDVEIKDIAIKNSVLVTPIAGLVTHIDTPVAGVNITPATAVFTIADPNKLLFAAEIDEVDIGYLAIGQTAALVLDAFPQEKIPVTLDKLDFAATTDSSGSTIFTAEFSLTNPPDQLKYRLGLNGEITITVASKQNVLAVPFGAIADPDNPTLKIIDNNQVLTVPVTTGLSNDEYIEILSGVSESQAVVIGEKN